MDMNTEGKRLNDRDQNVNRNYLWVVDFEMNFIFFFMPCYILLAFP